LIGASGDGPTSGPALFTFGIDPGRIIEGKGVETWAMQDRLGLMESSDPVGEVQRAGGQDKRDV
jgi:hypothetical protein